MYNLEPWFDRAHNIFLDWGIAGGLLGLIAYLSLYFVLLYSIWKRDTTLSHMDKSILTGLLAAYFFHNLFVFDHLLSYILFISILAYVHSQTSFPVRRIGSEPMAISKVIPYVLAPALIVLVFVVYAVNIRPIVANATLIEGLQITQNSSSDQSAALGYFQKAYDEARLGRPEVVEWVASSANTILGSSIKTEDKNAYFVFAKKVIEQQAADFEKDARYQILAGSFLTSTGYGEQGITYLKKAQTETPGKQLVYFQLGAAYIAKQDYKSALAVFKQAYDLAPEYQEARVIYLVGAIYVGDAKLTKDLLATLPSTVVATDDRIAGALLATGRYADLESLLMARINGAPKDPQGYISLASAYLKSGDKKKTIEILTLLGKEIPEYKARADQYIKGVQDGSLK